MSVLDLPWSKASDFVPRPHQSAGVDALFEYDGKYSVAEVTVAGGKSAMLAMLALRYSKLGRVLIIAHNEDLVKHDAAACRKLGIHPGICSSKLGVNAFARVTVGTRGTIANRLHLFKDVVAVLVDEVHMVPPSASSQYRKIFEALDKAKVHGLTGTPFRGDGTGTLEKTFGPIVFRYTFLDGLRDKFLKPIVPVDAGEDEAIDMDGIGTVGQDFDVDEMAPRAIKLAPSHAKTAVEVMARYGRKRAIVFACNIAHADRLEAEFKALGARVACVHSLSESGLRDKAIKALRAGELSVLISVAMFTTGLDIPEIDYIVFSRASQSAVLVAQGLGRGARATPEAVNCLLSDFGGNIERHGTLDAIVAAQGKVLECESCGEEWETWQNGKTCPKCNEIHKSAPRCKGCKERFDSFFHGMKCPHCQMDQSEVRKCGACEETYASFLHPTCPHCAFDNTAQREEGKDLKTRGGVQEAINVAKIIEEAPWQDIVSAPVKNEAGGWILPTRYVNVLWKFEHLPESPRRVYVKRAGNGRYTTHGVYDVHGKIHQV